MTRKILASLLFFISIFASAQIPSGYVETTATVPVLANGTFEASWTNLSSSVQLGLLGCVSTFQTTVSGKIDAYGTFSTLLADTAQICPSPSTWTFVLTFSCPAQEQPSSFQVQVPVTGGGGTEDISSEISALLPPNPCSTGTQTIIQVNGIATVPVSPVNFLDSPSVTWTRSGNQVSATAAPGIALQTNTVPNASQILMNFTDSPSIHFSNTSGGIETATVVSGTALAIEHVNSSSGILQNLMNWQDSPANLSGGSLDSGYQPVVLKTDAIGGWAAETTALNVAYGLTMLSVPPIAGQNAIAYPTANVTNSCEPSPSYVTANNTSGEIYLTAGGPGSCVSYINWSFSLVGGNVVTASGATIPIANVTAVYLELVGSINVASKQSNTTGTLQCSASGMTFPNVSQGQSLGQETLTASTSLSPISSTTFNAMGCTANVGQVNGLVNPPNSGKVNVSMVRAYVYYTGTPVAQPTQIYVKSPLYFNADLNTLGFDSNSFVQAYDLATTSAASLPSTTDPGIAYIVADGATATDCSTGGGTNKVLCYRQYNFGGNYWAGYALGGGGSGSVTSVAMTMPGAIFNATVTGSPITTSGTLAPTLATQIANTVLAGPTTGSAATPTFRAMVNADLPSTAVTPGSYTNANITVNQQGVVTAAANGSAGGVSSVAATSPIEVNGGAGPSTGAVTVSCPTCGTGTGNTTSTSLTTNTLPKANGANSIIDSLLTDDGTTAKYAGTGGIQATNGPISSGPDGVHAGLMSIYGNTTVPASLPSNSAGIIGPNSASFTSYFLQLPSTAPSGTQYLGCGTPSSNVSTCTWGSGGGSTTPVTTIASSGSSQALAFPSGGSAAYDITLTANCAITITGGTVGQYQSVVLILRQSGGGGFVPTLPAGVLWPGGVAPTPNTMVGRVDVFTLSTPDGGTTVLGSY